MRLPRSSRLAFVLLEHIAGRHGVPSTRRELGRALGLRPGAIAEPLAVLARAGILRSVRGPRGGFRLARAAAAVSLRQILEAANGPLFDDACIVHAGTCYPHALCPVHRLWHDAQEALLEGLGRFTLADLVAKLEGAGEIDRFLASLSDSTTAPAEVARHKGAFP